MILAFLRTAGGGIGSFSRWKDDFNNQHLCNNHGYNQLHGSAGGGGHDDDVDELN